MPGQNKQDEDYVAPKDSADVQAREFEDKLDAKERPGHEKHGTTSSAKPHSVRN
jgi:hypothetical protein